MHQINGRGTFLVSKACIPFLKSGKNPHILNLSPPLNLNPQWFMNHVAYTMAKYNMSMCALGMAEELRAEGIASNCIWPKTAIFTAAMEMLGGGAGIQASCRKPEIMADAAYAILCRDSKSYTANFCVDEDVLREEGITDFSPYEYGSNKDLMPDFFLDEKCQNSVNSSQYAIVGQGQSASTASAPPQAKLQGSGAGAGKGIPPDSDVGKLIATIKAAITDEVVQKTKAIFQFDITGDKGGKFYLDLKNTPGSLGSGEPPAPNKPDVIMTLKDSDFVQVFTGKVNPTTAYMTGKLKMKGDITKAMVLDKMMGKLKAKL
jgi:putative sterol carrier protein